MIVEVKIPEVGESVTEGLIAEWSTQDGAVVALDEPLLVLETDKVTMDINSQHAGRLEIVVPAGETVTVGQIVARIDTEAEAAVQETPAVPEADSRPAPAAAEAPATSDGPPLAAPAGLPQAHQTLDQLVGLSPAVQRLVVEHRLDPAAIQGTGKGGRLTKEDVLRHLSTARPDTTPDPEPVTKPEPRPTSAATLPVSTPFASAPEHRQTRSSLSPLRQRLAERLVQVQQTAAILTTFNEVDMTRVIELRKAYRPVFKERHDTDLGFMSFFVKACVDALKTFPEVNGFIDGGEMVTNHYYDIGVAVSTDKGLVVPVIRNADSLSMAEIESAVADLAVRARERRLELSDLTGAVFSISNGGVFGSLLSTPILNPPGSAILGMHTIQKRPVVIDDEIVIRPMMYLALSYDHRLIDGRGAVTFLRRIVDCVANPERMLLEV